LALEEGPYLVYDYWNREYLGEIGHSFDISLRPYASKGGAGEPYEMVVYVPKGLRIFVEGNHTLSPEVLIVGKNAWSMSFQPAVTGEFSWSIAFTPSFPYPA
jgi:hypothetical protein